MRGNEAREICMAQRLPHQGVPPFLGEALATAGQLLTAGRFHGDDGKVPPPQLQLPASLGGDLAYSQLQCAAALLTGDASVARHVLLHVNACSCSRLAPVCECILACRMVHLSYGHARVWRDEELELYFGSPGTSSLPMRPGAARASSAGAGAVLAEETGDERLSCQAYLLSLSALALELSDDIVKQLLPKLHSMVMKALQAKREETSGLSSSHASTRLANRRSTTAAEVQGQMARHKPVFVPPTDPISCLHATLDVLSVGSAATVRRPPPMPSAALGTGSLSGIHAAVVRAGITAASSASLGILERAESGAAAAASANLARVSIPTTCCWTTRTLRTKASLKTGLLQPPRRADCTMRVWLWSWSWAMLLVW